MQATTRVATRKRIGLTAITSRASTSSWIFIEPSCAVNRQPTWAPSARAAISGASSRVLALAEMKPVNGASPTSSRPLKPSMPSEVPAEIDSRIITPIVPPPTMSAPLPHAMSLSWRRTSLG